MNEFRFSVTRLTPVTCRNIAKLYSVARPEMHKSQIFTQRICIVLNFYVMGMAYEVFRN